MATPAAAAAERALCRQVLRLCRAADRRPQWLVPLFSRPAAEAAAAAPPVGRPFAEQALAEMARGSTDFAHPGGAAAAAARKHRRLLLALGFDYCGDAEEILRRVRRAQQVAEAVLAARQRPPEPQLKAAGGGRDWVEEQRQLAQGVLSTQDTGSWSTPGRRTGDLQWSETNFWDASGSTDSSPLEASDPYEGDHAWWHLVPLRFPEASGGAAAAGKDASALEIYTAYMQENSYSYELHDLTHVGAAVSDKVRVGDLLLTHPLACRRQPNLDRVVVLIDAVDAVSQHVRGVTLGVPHGSTLGDFASGRRISAKDREALSQFESLFDVPLWWGGTLREEGLLGSLSWLHDFGSAVHGARRVTKSLWIGGDLRYLAQAASMCEDVRRVQPVQGYIGWTADRLAAELRRGVWVRLRAHDSSGAVRSLALGDSGSSAPSLLGKQIPARPPGCAALGWSAALRAAGLSGLADFPRGGAADKYLKEALALEPVSLIGYQRVAGGQQG